MNRRTYLASAAMVALTGCLEERTTGAPETSTTGSTPSPTPERESTEASTKSPTATRTETPRSGTVSIEVGPGNVFRPFEVAITAGTTVEWVWRDGGHNVVVSARPEQSGWTGHGAIEDDGYVDEHVFTVEGTYRYYCSPHRAQGMTGTIHVR